MSRKYKQDVDAIACAFLDFFEPILYNESLYENHRHFFAELAVSFDPFSMQNRIATICNLKPIVVF